MEQNNEIISKALEYYSNRNKHIVVDYVHHKHNNSYGFTATADNDFLLRLIIDAAQYGNNIDSNLLVYADEETSVNRSTLLGVVNKLITTSDTYKTELAEAIKLRESNKNDNNI